ncbi:MAG TPA: ferritin-like domain-containing protein [Candidatus Lokiarchaeia archaeon]|nr:ferritin-like domain-containing protein [Candidatus Lokiarchaeia archaeon]
MPLDIEVTPEYMDLLNKGVAREIQVAVQYMLQHSKMEKLLRKMIPENILLDKTTYEAVGKVLKAIAIDEMKHLGKIMERIYILGGEATTKPSHVEIGNSLREFGELGKQAEIEALTLYRQILDMAGQLGDWETRELFEDIYEDEEKHFLQFQDYSEIEGEPDFPPVNEEEFQAVYTEDWVALLNRAVAGELSAIVQYTNQHEKANAELNRRKKTALEVISNKTKPSVFADLLKSTFMQEMEHVEKIAERIYEIKMEVKADVEPLPNVGAEVDDWIQNDRDAEDYAINLYRQIIAKALEINDVRTRLIFEHIIDQEEEHFWRFDDFTP